MRKRDRRPNHGACCIIIAVFLCLLPLQTWSQEIIAHRNKVPGTYNFWLYVPSADCYGSTDMALDSTVLVSYAAELLAAELGESIDGSEIKQKVPVIIFLHGKSLCGTNLNNVLRYGCLDALRRGKRINAYVLAPQNTGSAWWNPDKITKLLDWVLEQYPDADADRVYVVGMSLGGYGTLDYVGTYPDRVAAAMALCGGTTLKDFDKFLEVPLWIVHGTADRAVPVSASQDVVAGMAAAAEASDGNIDRLLYDWLQGYDHGQLARFFYMDLTYNWLFSHSLSDEGRPVNKDYTITKEQISDCYKDFDKDFGASVKVIAK